MTCLMVTSIFAPINGGSAVVYENLCKYAPEGSIVVLTAKYHCATGEYLEGWQEHDAKAEYPVYRINLLRPKIVGSMSKLHSLYLLAFVDYPLRIKVFLTALKLVKKHNINILCVGELHSLSWLGKWLKVFHDIKVINYIHGEEVTTEANYSSFQRTRDKYLKAADAIVAVSGFTRNYLINRFRLPADKITLIPNGVDTSKFDNKTVGSLSKELRKRYDIEDKKVFITVGRLVARKGFDVVIQSMPNVLAKHPDAHYVIVGTGPYRDELERMTKELELTDNITFTGRVEESELVAHYSMGDAFIMPNRTMPDGDTEGFGLVFLEANACEIPVIAGRAGGAQEAVLDGVNGISVDGFDLSEVQHAMLRILDDPEYAVKLVEQGKEHVKSVSFQQCAKQFDKLCQMITNNIKAKG